ncbi:hypothetical protein AVEN_7987-1 [Araneus ventricosus]|uniref:Uncharacterized protein n=1 Tax=Araneus ventricosus TaxID=182803 RepID=A0A4Y2K2Q4_ARAVE|nr:hypothetical protein AVEN_7987-1 [Araneus ventricosus]
MGFKILDSLIPISPHLPKQKRFLPTKVFISSDRNKRTAAAVASACVTPGTSSLTASCGAHRRAALHQTTGVPLFAISCGATRGNARNRMQRRHRAAAPRFIKRQQTSLAAISAARVIAYSTGTYRAHLRHQRKTNNINNALRISNPGQLPEACPYPELSG